MSEKKEKVILEMTREQADTIETACELLARLHIGQFREITNLLLPFSSDIKDFNRKRDDANDALNLAANIIFGRTSYGTPDAHKTKQHNTAWSLYEVLRYTRSWHDHPEGDKWNVCFDKPRSWNPEEPLAKCRIVEDE